VLKRARDKAITA